MLVYHEGCVQALLTHTQYNQLVKVHVPLYDPFKHNPLSYTNHFNLNDIKLTKLKTGTAITFKLLQNVYL